MGRYRAPQARSSPHITPDGFASLQAEEKALWQRRKDVTVAVTAAAAEGDRSENAEYIYRKKELREIDRRIRYLQKRLPSLQVVHPRDMGALIYFGATVDLLDGETPLRVRLVGADEIDPARHYISIDSPLATVLLKQSAGAEVQIDVDGTRHRYTVVAVNYPPA